MDIKGIEKPKEVENLMQGRDRGISKQEKIDSKNQNNRNT